MERYVAATKKKAKRKFVVISKVDNNTFVKYRTDNFENLILFLKKKYPDLRFCNIYNNKPPNENKLVYTFGKIKGIQPAY